MELKETAQTFFKKLFWKDNSVDPKEILNLIQPLVTQEINDVLLKEYTDEEISFALFQIGPLKAPRPDGLPARFFQRNWGTIKGEIIQPVRHFFANGEIPEGANDTVLVL